MKKLIACTLVLCLLTASALAAKPKTTFASVAEHWVKTQARPFQNTEKLEQGINLQALLTLCMTLVLDKGEAKNEDQLLDLEPLINVLEEQKDGKTRLLFSFTAMAITGTISILLDAHSGEVVRLQVEDAGGNG